MRILMVSIPSLHFFRWASQLEDSGHEVFWFDSTGMSAKVPRIDWMEQNAGWKLKWNYPARTFIKNKFPRLYRFIQSFNENKIEVEFEKYLQQIQPDVVHSFAMQLSCLPILGMMKQHQSLKWIYSSWGSDIFFYKELKIQPEQFCQILDRVNYLITDCKRDFEIAKLNGFNSSFMGVFIGNGGLSIKRKWIEKVENRNLFLIKGYEDGIGKALQVLEAIELLPFSIFENIEIIIYSSDLAVSERLENFNYFPLKIKVYKRSENISNDDLMKLMGKSVIHIANSISDGMPNALLEAMAMGAFPIQSNPGKVTEEVIVHGVNGYLIDNPFDTIEIARCIEKALVNQDLRKTAQEYNVKFIEDNYNREILKNKIIEMYEQIN